MKAIIYYVPFGRPLEDDTANAKLIAAETGERVVFRNGSLASSNSEAPEPCVGYAGQVPDSEAYKTKPVYSVNEDGEVSKDAEPETDAEDEEETNKLGLPLGSPETAKELKAVFDEHEIEYHKSAKVGVLVDLYRSEILVLENE